MFGYVCLMTSNDLPMHGYTIMLVSGYARTFYNIFASDSSYRVVLNYVPFIYLFHVLFLALTVRAPITQRDIRKIR